jgi:hypothetical protein
MVSGWLVLTPMGTSGRISFRVLPRVIPANFHAENQSKTLAGSHPFSDTRPTLVSPPRTPDIVHLQFFVCKFVPPPLSQFHDQTKLKFQGFNTMSIWVLLLRDSCKPMLLCIEQRVGCFVNWIFSPFVLPYQYEFYCWGILVTDATLHWATCWMFCELNLFYFLFLGHLDGDHRLQMACWLSKFIWVRCRIRWCWMLESWIFSRSICVFGSFGKVIRGSKWQADQAKQVHMSQVWDSMTH